MGILMMTPTWKAWPPAPIMIGVLFAFLAGQPAQAAEAVGEGQRARLLIMNLEAAEGDEGEASAILRSLTVALSEEPYFSVVSGAELRQMLELEAQKSLMGCDDESCLAEIAGALGARWVVMGAYHRLGDGVRTDLTLYDAESLSILRRVFFEADSGADAVDRAPRAALRLVAAYEEENGIFTLRHVNPWPWALAGTGVLSFGGGIAAAVVASRLFSEQAAAGNRLAELEDPSSGNEPDDEVVEETRTAALSARDDYQVWGIPLIITAAVTGVAGLALAAMGTGWLIKGDGVSEVE
jgi:hypothetical protein